MFPMVIASAAALLLSFSAIFSASEAGLFSFPRERMWHYGQSSSVVDKWGYRLLANGQRLLLPMLLGNTFVDTPLDGPIHSFTHSSAIPGFNGLEPQERLRDWLPCSLLEKASEVSTLNGLSVNYLGRIPGTGESFAVGGVSFYIVEAGPTAAKRVRITKRGREDER